MLKYTNTTKTAAQFNGAFFSLAAPEDFTSIGDGPTRDAVLRWIAAGNTPVALPPPTQAELDLPAKNAIKAKLAEIDLKSIRAIREYIASRIDAPTILKNHEAEAQNERAKIK